MKSGMQPTMRRPATKSIDQRQARRTTVAKIQARTEAAIVFFCVLGIACAIAFTMMLF